jgi:glyoxylase-like metal-dependent hydrolase (beta-lactamase superfamily II)
VGEGGVLGVAGGDLESWFVPLEVRAGIWLIAEPGHVHSYLVAGAERAVLLDTGTGIAPIGPVARSLTDRPISVVLTHSHFDHVGGAGDFDRIAVHPSGIERLRAGRPAESLRGYVEHTRRLVEASRRMREIDAEGLHVLHPEQIVRPLPPGFDPEGYAIAPIEATETLVDGARIELGGRRLEVIHAPGHSPDSLCLLEREARLLFTADTVYAGPLYARLPDSEPETYLASLRRLEPLIEAVDLLLPGHNRVPLDPPIIREMIGGFERLLSGTATPVERVDALGRRTREARFARFSILLPA